MTGLKLVVEHIAKFQMNIERWLAGVSFVVVMIMMFLTTVDVILRYLFNSPIPGAFEVEAMLLVFVVFPSLAYIQSKKAHIRVDVLVNQLPLVAQRFVSIIGHFISLFIFGVITWQSGVAAHEAWITEEYTMGLIPYPFWPAKWALTIGVGFFSLRFVSDIFYDLGHLIKILHKSPEHSTN